MPRLLVLFNLADGTTPAEYESWARDEDTPAMLCLASIRSKTIFRAAGLWGSDETAPYQYAEMLDVEDLGRMQAEIGTAPGAADLVRRFNAMTRDLSFIVIEPIDPDTFGQERGE